MKRAILAALVLVCLAAAAQTANAQAITVTSPAANQVLRAGTDYATDVLGDPWDMKNAEDISIDPYDRAGWGADFALDTVNRRVGGTTVPTVLGSDTQLSFLYRGRAEVLNPGRSGLKSPIDSAVYKKLSFKMYSGAAGQETHVQYFHNPWGTPVAQGGEGRGTLVLRNTPTTANIAVYSLDLTGIPDDGSRLWTDSVVRGLRIDPNSTASGHLVYFYWARLTRADNDPLAVSQVITWAGGQAGSSTTIDVIDASSTVLPVKSGIADGTNTYTWYYGLLPPGAYQLRITKGNVVGYQAFTINDPPIARLTNPDEIGGADFATDELGYTWNMQDSRSVESSVNITSASFANGFYNATQNASGDPVVLTLNGFSNPRPIDTSRYRHLTYWLQLDTPYDLGAGSMTRIFWGNNQTQLSLMSQTVDILAWPGLNSYTIDLGALSVGKAGGIEPLATANVWPSSDVFHFRIDPDEFPRVINFHLGRVTLTAPDEAFGTFLITWNSAHADATQAATLSLYYAQDTDPTHPRVLIAGGLPLAQGSYTWNTANVTPGTYYIYVEATDGVNTTGFYSTGPVVTTQGGPSAYRLSVAVSGSGTVSSSPGGITSCGATCSRRFSVGSSVALTATAGTGSVFAGWGGDVDCQDGQVTMGADHACTASFLDVLPGGPTRGSIDLNGDGRGDMFRYFATTGQWSMDFSNTSGTFGSRVGNWSPGWTVKGADFNNDGMTDFLLYDPVGGTAYMLVNSGGDFIYSRADWSPGWDITVIDFDGDGRSDLFLYNPTNGVWFRAINVGLGIDQFAYTGGTWDPGFTIATGDFNGDRRGDLFLYHPTVGTWWEVLTTPTFGFDYYGPGIMSDGWTVTTADFNGDGRSDVFLYRPLDGLWFEAITTGPGAFDWSRSGTWDPGFVLAKGDFNADGLGDLFLYHPTVGTWWEVLGTPPGTFTYYGPGIMSEGWTLNVTDYNADRKSDVLLYRPTDGVWFTATSTGPGTFNWASGNWGPGWTIIGSRPNP